MNKQHFSLHPSTNIILTLLWGAISITLLINTVPYQVLIFFIASVLGIIGGIMQILGFRQAKHSFLDAQTMSEVRAKLKSTTWGKRYIYYLWGSNIFLLTIAFFVASRPVVAIVLGFFTFMFFREIITLKQTFELKKMQNENI